MMKKEEENRALYDDDDAFSVVTIWGNGGTISCFCPHAYDCGLHSHARPFLVPRGGRGGEDKGGQEVEYLV